MRFRFPPNVLLSFKIFLFVKRSMWKRELASNGLLFRPGLVWKKLYQILPYVKLQTNGAELELMFLKLLGRTILSCAIHSRQGVIVVEQGVAAAQEQTPFIWGSLRKPANSNS